MTNSSNRPFDLSRSREAPHPVAGNSRRLTAFRTLLLAGVTAFGLSTPALAQQDTGSAKDTARTYDVISPGGVSYATGAFTYKLPLLSIGSGEFPRSLSYGLWYNSGSARSPNQPWTHNLTVRTSRTLIDDPAATSPEPDGKPHPEWQTWLYNVVLAQRSEGFENYDLNQATNPYNPVTKTGSSLVFTSSPTGGYHTYTGSRGEIIQFRPLGSSLAAGQGDVWTEPDGTRLKFNYTAGAMSVENNLGYALLLEAPVLVTTGIYDQEICLLNLTQHYLPSTTACPTSVPTTKVRFTSSTATGYREVSSVTAPDGGVYNFTYAQSTRGTVTRRALSCIKQPGSSTCSVTNTYDTCDQRYGASPSEEDPSWTGSRDRVTNQSYPTGESVSYVYTSGTGCRGNSQAEATNAISAKTTVKALSTGVVTEVKDPLLRQSLFTYTGDTAETLFPQATLVATATNPEGDRTEYTYDARGNVTSVRKKAKLNSGLADIVTSASFAATCTNRVTCNKPTSTTDARGNITDFTYDPVHGGILTETAPAAATGQPRPQTRYTYVQRSAQILNSTGSFVQAATPVWLLASKSICKTSAAPCSTTDEVKTTYDYGPTTGANNLLLRGIVVDAGGLSLRTCYGYDSLGRKISETRPRAGLASCP